jgi:hypothetical protein
MKHQIKQVAEMPTRTKDAPKPPHRLPKALDVMRN